MPCVVRLTEDEIEELDQQNPATAGDGGFQSLLVGLQKRLDRVTGELHLTDDDLERIQRYAYEYRQGGWQDRLERIFCRELGPDLGR